MCSVPNFSPSLRTSNTTSACSTIFVVGMLISTSCRGIASPPIARWQAYETAVSVTPIGARDRGADVAIPQPREGKGGAGVVGVYEYGDARGSPVFVFHGPPAGGPGLAWAHQPARER